MQRLHYLFMGWAEELALGAAVTAGQLQNLFMAVPGNRSAFYSRHVTYLLICDMRGETL
jgi:nicotinamide mononucleotide (NMN) deamidase PncC